MAKNVPTSDAGVSLHSGSETVYEGRFVGTFEGDLTGNVTGNATTADALRQAMRITFTGDAGGSFQSNGSNATCNLTVTRADRAHEADHATTADTVTKAVNADHAAHAEYADHAVSADKAALADSATYAESAGSAQNASHATTADSAVKAETAKEADSAVTAAEAEHAKESDVALVAYSLDNGDNPVPFAEHAKEADHAIRADYDCYGRAIHLTYALKDEVVMKDDAFTEDDANALFARKDELILQATISGKAWGYGTVNGQTLNLVVKKLDVDGDGNPGIYSQLEFLTTKDLPDNPDTTMAYMTSDQLLWYYDADAGKWKDVRSKLSQEAEDALDKLNGFVDLTSDQTEIHGTKGFWDPVYAPIPSFREAPDHAVAVMSNVRYVYDTLKQLIDEIRTALGLGAEVGLIGGDFLSMWLREEFNYEDYTPETGEFAVFGVEDCLEGIEVDLPHEILPDGPSLPDIPVTPGPTDRDIDSVNLLENGSVEDGADNGQMNIFGMDDCLADVTVDDPFEFDIPETTGGANEFSSLSFDETGNYSENTTATTGQFLIEPADDAFAGIDVEEPVD